jgi:type I restriction-modification system DNA methylase subunit/restriction endonuclease S subunit
MSQISIKNTMAEVEKFKSAIPRVRDILRASSITGMDSMRHVCFYLLSRYITDKNVERLNIPKKLSWENIFVKAFEDEDVALQLFKHDLIDQFDKLFGTQQFSFEMKSGVKHKEILEIFNGISMEGIDLHMDILGYVYEQHLKTGSSAARDLGQFFTDRFICEYMVKICQPKFKLDGIPESVCDPTMGTGGFLTAYLKQFKNVDWSKYQTQIHGVDHDAKVAGVSRLNMFMESGGEIFKHLHTADSLHGGLNPTTYDIILANMPFGLKGLKYKDVHQSIKTLALDGTKSEPLFLQLMMVSLNKGGRCAVVVPEGMLVNNSKCHIGTREYLLEHFEVKRVIKMKGKFFMNTSIQPSILFFENSGKKTEQVEFWDVERDEKGNFTEKVVVSVPAEKFDESYSLDMRKYQETEKKDYNEEFQIIKLGDILNDYSVKNPIPTTKCDGGEYKLFSSSVDVFHHSEAEFKGGEYLIQGSRGTISGATHYCNTPFSASNNVFILSSKNEDVVLKYVYYYLKISKVTDSTATTSIIPMLTKTMFRSIEIHIPSLELQTQIVEELDSIYDSKKNASNIIENLKKQMKSIVKNIDYRNYENVELKTLITAAKGKIQATKCDNGEWPVVSISDKWTHSEYTEEGENVFIASTSRGTSSGPFETVVKYYNGKCTFTNLMQKLEIKNKEVISYKYLYYSLQKIQSEIEEKCEKGTCNKTMNVDIFLQLRIPVPPLDVQQSIVERLDAMQVQISCMEKIENQADNNAKFILNGYLGV